MTYKQIEASREVRLWIRDIIVPTAAIVGGVLYSNPELRYKAKRKFNDVKESVKDKFSKGKES